MLISRSLVSASASLPLVTVLVLAFAVPVSAAEIAAASRIDAVTVYPDAASVARVVDVDLLAGQSSLLFAGLPAGLDPASLRVSGEAAGNLTILSVVSRPAPVVPKPDSGLEARLKALRSEREGWQATLDALEAKKAMMLRFAQASPEKLSDNAKPLDITDWNNAWDTVGVGLAKVGDELRSAHERTRDLDDQIKALEAARQAPRSTAPAQDVRVELVADDAFKAHVTLSYRIGGASWRPAYDARLDTSASGHAPTLEFVRRAEVTQSTGEDWSGIALTLSTLRAAQGTSAPDLATQRIVFFQPPVFFPADASAPRATQKSLSAAVPAVSPLAGFVGVAPAASPSVPAQEQQSNLDAGAYQADFRVPDRLDVPGDGSVKILRIASRTVTPDLSVKSVPVLDPTAYLQAHFVNDEDAPLLPGDLTLERDGSFIGKGHVAFAAPGDNVDLGLGADDKIVVTRVPVRKKENDPSAVGQTKIVTREFKTTVKNLHNFPVNVGIVDRIPVSENNAIIVEQLPTTTPATDKTVSDKRGVMRWTYMVAPGETKEIKLGYRIKWPADQDVVFQNVANNAMQP